MSACLAFLGHVDKQPTWCIVPYMAIFTKYGNKIIPNAHWEWPLGIKFLQWVFQPHSGRNTILAQPGLATNQIYFNTFMPGDFQDMCRVWTYDTLVNKLGIGPKFQNI